MFVAIAAARNFLNALDRIPSMVEQYEEKNKALERDIPLLQEIVGKVWKKEDELKQLKSELVALDRKIQLELAPPVPEVKQQEEKQEVSERPVLPKLPQTEEIQIASVPPSGNRMAGRFKIG